MADLESKETMEAVWTPSSLPTTAPTDTPAPAALDTALALQQQPDFPASLKPSLPSASSPSSAATDSSLSQHYSELMAQNELLAKENRLFDSFLHRHSVQLIEAEKSPKHNRRDKQRQQNAATGHSLTEPTLSDLDRNRLALEELEYRTQQFQSLQNKSTEDIALLKSIAVNLDIRMQELKKESFEFQREVVMAQQPSAGSGAARQSGANASNREAEGDDSEDTTVVTSATTAATATTGTSGCVVSSEALIRFFTERLKSKRSLIGKLKVKTRNIRSQIRVATSQLKAKEEQGDSLHSIDFHQLQIKNSQFNARIKERNELLLGLKQNCAKSVTCLNEAKKMLSEEIARNKALRMDSRIKQSLLAKMTAELAKVQAEIAEEQTKIVRAKQLQSNPDMPHVMDYVRQRLEINKLRHQHTNLSRKIEIAKLENSGRDSGHGGGGSHARTVKRGRRVKTAPPALLLSATGVHFPALHRLNGNA